MDKLIAGIRNNIILVVGALLAGLAGAWYWGLLIGAGAAYLHCLFNGMTKGRTLKDGLILCCPTMMLFGVIFMVGAQVGGGLTSFTGWLITALLMVGSAFVGSFVSGSKDYQDKIRESDQSPTVRPTSQNTEQAPVPAPAPAVQSFEDMTPEQREEYEQAQEEIQAPIGVAAMLANARRNKNATANTNNRPIEPDEQEKLKDMIRQMTGLQDITSTTYAMAYKQLPADERALLPNDPEKALLYKLRGITLTPSEVLCRKLGYVVPDFILKPLLGSEGAANVDKVRTLFIDSLPKPLNCIPVTTLVWYIPNSLFSSSLQDAVKENAATLAGKFSDRLPEPLKYIPLRTLWGALPADARKSPNNIMRDIEYNTPKLLEEFSVKDLSTINSSFDTQLPVTYRGRSAKEMREHACNTNPALLTVVDSDEAVVLNNLETLQTMQTLNTNRSEAELQDFYNKLSRWDKVTLPKDPKLAYAYYSKSKRVPIIEAVRRATGMSDLPEYMLSIDGNNADYNVDQLKAEVGKFDATARKPLCYIPTAYHKMIGNAVFLEELGFPYCLIPADIINGLKEYDSNPNFWKEQLTAKGIQGDYIKLCTPLMYRPMSISSLAADCNMQASSNSPLAIVNSAIMQKVQPSLSLSEGYLFNNLSDSVLRSMYISLLDIEDDETTDNVFCHKHKNKLIELFTVIKDGENELEIPTILLAYLIGHEKLEANGQVFSFDYEGLCTIRSYVANHTSEVLNLFTGSPLKKYPAKLLSKFSTEDYDKYSAKDCTVENDEYWRLLIPVELPSTDVLADKLGDNYNSMYEGECIINNLQDIC